MIAPSDRKKAAFSALQGLCSNTALFDERVMRGIVEKAGRGPMTPAAVVAMLAVQHGDALMAELERAP